MGLPYWLGVGPEKHGASDCMSLATSVQSGYGIDMPVPQRSWYRRLLRKDYSVFSEQLELWGVKTDAAKVGTLGLIHCLDGNYALTSLSDN